MKKRYRIGCSGYYYSYWKNRFYPNGLLPKNWLEYYSSVFNTVELNGTFYRTPKLSDLKKNADVTDKNFRFSVKMSRYITHIMKLEGSKSMILEFQDLILNGLEKKLSCFLFQMPPSFYFTDENLERILKNIPHKKENVVELRHSSWWNETVKNELKKAKITFCNVDFPGLNSFIIQTTPLFYFRFHGNPDLFKSSYTEEQLRLFYSGFPEKTKEHFIYFNNTYYEAGYTNALQLKKIISHA